MNCQFVTFGKIWRCSVCGRRSLLQDYVVKCPGCATFPFRNSGCGTSKPKQNTRVEQVVQRSNGTVDNSTLSARLAICEACEKYSDYQCITMGSSCRKPARWQEKVINGMCEKFQ